MSERTRPRGRILDEYLADYERRKGPVAAQEQEEARQVFDEVFAEDGDRVRLVSV